MSVTRKRSLAHLRLSVAAQAQFDCSTPRSGKWSHEEEAFAKTLIVQFEEGSLEDCEEGATLRSYLSKRLRCAPMRISKKFAGQCIGKHTFVKKECKRSSNEEESTSEPRSVSDAYDDDVSTGTRDFVPTIMSFDTFTYYQMCQSESCETADVTVNTGVFIPAEIHGPHLTSAGVHVITDRSPDFPDATFCANANRRVRSVSELEVPSVGLDLDELFLEARTSAADEGSVCESADSDVVHTCSAPKASADHHGDQLGRETPQPGPAGLLPSDAHIVCHHTPKPVGYGSHTQPERIANPLPATPTAVVRSGAAQFSPMVQRSPVMEYKPVDPEAAEWHDVLAYFCGKPAHSGLASAAAPALPSAWLSASAEPQTMGAQLLHQ